MTVGPSGCDSVTGQSGQKNPMSLALMLSEPPPEPVPSAPGGPGGPQTDSMDKGSDRRELTVWVRSPLVR